MNIVHPDMTNKKTSKQGPSKRRARPAATKPRSTRKGDSVSRSEHRAARKDRIIDVAIRLAEQGGFENVRQRDVAAQAGVALGTLYKSFRGKGDILSAALERETQAIEKRLHNRPLQGNTADERLRSLFDMLTKALCRKPTYARAVLRAMASGDPDITSNIVAYQTHVYSMIVSAMRGTITLDPQNPPTEDETAVALLIQQIWFASLVGWSAKLHTQSTIVEQVCTAARWLLAGQAVGKTTATR